MIIIFNPYDTFCFYRCCSYNAWQYPCFPLLFDTKTSKCSLNGRSRPICNKQAYLTPRQQLNELSAFIDGSQIYSNNENQYMKLQGISKSPFDWNSSYILLDISVYENIFTNERFILLLLFNSWTLGYLILCKLITLYMIDNINPGYVCARKW